MKKRILLLVFLAWVVSFLPVAVSAQESEDSQRIREEIRKHKEAIAQLREKLHEIETPPMAQAQAESADYQEETSGGENYGNEGNNEGGNNADRRPFPPRKIPIEGGEPHMGKDQRHSIEGTEGQQPGMRRPCPEGNRPGIGRDRPCPRGGAKRPKGGEGRGRKR